MTSGGCAGLTFSAKRSKIAEKHAPDPARGKEGRLLKKDRVANPVIGRLPRYYRCVEELYLVGCVRVSSATLSQRLGFTASQIRQDFSNFGEFGQQGYGYNVRKLRYEIREILGLNSRNTAILVGCGNLGQALLKNFDFESCGFFMLAAFDIDPAKADTYVGSVPVMDMGLLERFVASEKPSMAVLTVSRDSAPEAAARLADLGIQAIWDFVGGDLQLGDRDVLVEHVSFSDSLLTLSYRLNQRRGPEEPDIPPDLQ